MEMKPKLNLNGIGFLEFKPSIEELRIRQLDPLMEPLSAEQLKNYKNRDTDDEYKILKQVTTLKDHTKMLYLVEHSKTHNRYASV